MTVIMKTRDAESEPESESPGVVAPSKESESGVDQTASTPTPERLV